MNSAPLSANSKAIRFIILLAILLAGLFVFQSIGGNGSNSQVISPNANLGDLEVGTQEEDWNNTNSVRLSMVRQSIETDEPVELAPSMWIPWEAGQTLLDATRLAGTKRTEWQSSWQGEAEMALLVELGGLTNEGSEGLNWQFDLNDKYGERGAGQTRLNAGDHALWRLAPYE